MTRKRISQGYASLSVLFIFFVIPFLSIGASNQEPAGDNNELPAVSVIFSPLSYPYLLDSAEADIFYASYRNNSWAIPDEVIKTNDLWIEVDLTQQMLYAYRGNQLLSGFVVSTGIRSYRTVTGIYKVYAKYPLVDMRGPGYDLSDVPYTMFFYKGYAIHGTYWHNNFGTPMSRGCVNMITEESAWLYEQTAVGAYVIVHY